MGDPVLAPKTPWPCPSVGWPSIPPGLSAPSCHQPRGRKEWPWPQTRPGNGTAGSLTPWESPGTTCSGGNWSGFGPGVFGQSPPQRGASALGCSRAVPGDKGRACPIPPSSLPWGAGSSPGLGGTGGGRGAPAGAGRWGLGGQAGSLSPWQVLACFLPLLTCCFRFRMLGAGPSRPCPGPHHCPRPPTSTQALSHASPWTGRRGARRPLGGGWSGTSTTAPALAWIRAALGAGGKTPAAPAHVGLSTAKLVTAMVGCMGGLLGSGKGVTPLAGLLNWGSPPGQESSWALCRSPLMGFLACPPAQLCAPFLPSVHPSLPLSAYPSVHPSVCLPPHPYLHTPAHEPPAPTPELLAHASACAPSCTPSLAHAGAHPAMGAHTAAHTATGARRCTFGHGCMQGCTHGHG